MKLKHNAVDLTELAIGIIILGIVVSVGANILINIRDTKLTDLTVVTTTNESLTFTGNTATLTNKWGASITSITNQSTGSALNTGNYTYSINAGDGTITITNLTSTGQPWYATYTAYNTTQADWALADNASTGIAEYGNWFKIIVIVGVAAVVLGLIFMAFGRGSNVGSEGIGGTY